MEPDDPISARVERTFWTVWYYISGAVNRFLRPEPTNVSSNDTNPTQESAVASKPADVGPTEGDARGGGVDEEQPEQPSLLSPSRPLVAREFCTADVNLGPDEESVRYDARPRRGSESEASEDGEGMREEQFIQAGHADAGLLVARENGDGKLSAGGQDEIPENGVYEEHAHTRSPSLSGDVASEDADAQEETERATTPEDPQKMGKTTRNTKVKEADDKMQHEDEIDLQARDIELKCTPITDLSPEEEDHMHREEVKVQRNEADTAVRHEEVEISDGETRRASENENEADKGTQQVENQLSVCEDLSDVNSFTSRHVESQMAKDECAVVSADEPVFIDREQRSENDNVDDAEEEEEEGESMLDEDAVTKEENANEAAKNDRTTGEAPEEDDDVKAVSEDSRENVVQNAATELRTTEFADGEQDDVAKDAEVQTKTREADDDKTVIDEKSDVNGTHISVDERSVDKDQVEGESYLETVGTTTAVTVKPEGEPGQEMSGEFNNIPPGSCEGPVVEFNFPTCEETREGVPEYNNEPDENTTPRFLEGGDCKEIQGSQLPEEVESNEPESLENSGCISSADYLLAGEHMEERQESSFDTGFPQEAEKPLVEPVSRESGYLFEEEEGELLVKSMKTGIEHSEKEFESNVGIADDATKELHDEKENISVEYEINGGSCDSEADADGDGGETTGAEIAEEAAGLADGTFLEAEVQKMTEASFFQESVDDGNMVPDLLEDVTELGFLKRCDETEDVEMPDAGIDLEETGFGDEEVAAEGEMPNRNETEILSLWGTAELESSRPGTKDQLSDEALETPHEEMLSDAEAADESKTAESEPEDLTLISMDKVVKHVTESEGSFHNVIEEEILDLWLQTASSEYADCVKQQEGPEPGLQMEPLNEELEEISSVQTEEDNEQLVGLNSRESELASDTDVSSSTVESGFLDQPLGEWGAQSSETQLLKSTSTGSLQGICDVLANRSDSADLPEPSTQQPHSESQDIAMEETAETEHRSYLKVEELIAETGFHPDSGDASPEARHWNQESDESQEKTEEERVESVEAETGSQKEIDAEVTDRKDTEEGDGEEMSALFEVEKEDDPLLITVSDSPNEIKHAESGRSRGGSETLSEDEIVSIESGSQGDTSVDKPEPGWTEDIAESLPGLSSADVAEQPTTESEEREEVDASALDFAAQRSRIAVKNPRVRPPKDPRSLLHMPSLDPTPSPRPSAKVPAGVPLGGLGMGIKLPGLGAGFPVLKKTQRGLRDANIPDTFSQEAKQEEKSDTPEQDEPQHKPKWISPRHPGVGNPLMSELKTKLKKTTKE